MMDRREFLGTSGRMMLTAGVFVACGRAVPKPAAPATHANPVDWNALARTLGGQLVLPSDPGYATARQLFNPRFDQIRPAAIAFCRSVTDVQRSIVFARDQDILLAVRSGGHSYASYSTGSGVVIDVTGLTGVTIDPTADTATVGGGARLIDVYTPLAQAGMSIPAGSCATVGIAGLTLGGGMGKVGRRYGLTCDVMTAAQVVTADGQIHDCNDQHNPDLFWACRGGGGGNFGVATAFTFRTHQIPNTDVSLFKLDWPWPAAGAVLDAWQTWATAAPDELFSACKLQTSSPKTLHTQPEVTASGLYLGSPQRLQALVDLLVAQIGINPTSYSVQRSPSYLHAMITKTGCKTADQQCHVRERRPSCKASDFLFTPLSDKGIATIMRAIEQRQAAHRLAGATVDFNTYGGAINRLPPDATAFVHRNTISSIQYTAAYVHNDPADVVDANAAWLRDFYAAMRPYVSGFAYQNYIDPNLENWEHAYYGPNYGRLVQIKTAYDPDNVFRFPQSIPTHDNEPEHRGHNAPVTRWP